MPSKRGNGNRAARRPALRAYLDRVKSSRRRERVRTTKPSASGTSRTRVAKRASSLAPRTVVVGTLCVVAAAVLVMSRQSSIANWVAELDAKGNVTRLERVESFDPATMSSTPAAPSAPATVSVTTRSSESAVIAAASVPAAKHVEPATAKYEFATAPASTPEPPARLVPASLRTTETEPEPSAAPAVEQAAAAVPATLAGCLERSENTFVLKNVSGQDAPKARSWKSGFLRKKSPTVELVDGGSSSRLAAYVGRRIETTGALADREMHVKTLRVLGACE